MLETDPREASGQLMIVKKKNWLIMEQTKQKRNLKWNLNY
jgi:hypothetical protein